MRLRDRQARALLEQYGLSPRDARRAARRARACLGDLVTYRDLVHEGDVDELLGFADALVELGEPPPAEGGVLMLTLHYGIHPMLWFWLKRAAHLGRLPRFTLFYDSTQYVPDGTPTQYARLGTRNVVQLERDDLDVAVLGVRRALVEARRRLAAGEAVLIYPDARAVPGDRGRPLTVRVGNVTVAYPAGATLLARVPGLRLQGVAIRPWDGGHEIVWATPRETPASHGEVEAALQELFELTVARDPAPWQNWIEA